MIDTSSKTDQLLAALVATKAKLQQPKKEKQGYGYKYADLAMVENEIDKAIKAADSGLFYSQEVYDDIHGPAVSTTIYHKSGQYMTTSKLTLPVQKNDAQGFGSAITYARRYQLTALFGIASEDDDGAYDSQRNQMPQQRQQPRRPVQRRQPTHPAQPKQQPQATRPQQPAQPSLKDLKDQYGRGLAMYQKLTGKSQDDARNDLGTLAQQKYGKKLATAQEPQRYEMYIKTLAKMVKNEESKKGSQQQ